MMLLKIIPLSCTGVAYRLRPRYSLYYGARADAIKTFAQKSILLVDCKQVFDVCGHKTCLLYRTEELLEVSL